MVALPRQRNHERTGWQGAGLARRWVGLVVRRPALVFARQVLAFDDAVARAGIRAASQVLLSAYVEGLRVRGAERIPARGPVLLLSNHPGMTDTAALFAAIQRADLKILAADRPFLRALPAAARSLIFIPEDPRGRLPALRAAVEHLRAGGALLTFPAGEIEPDPAVLPGAREALTRWSASSALFLRAVPQSFVVPVVVSGVLSPRAQRHPIALLRRKRPDRERLAAMLQIVARTMSPGAWPVRVSVEFLQPFAPGELVGGRDAALAAIRDRVAEFLRPRARA
jgi:1-acyl-sn-glycerol-3-phosphate acyltransferase